MHGLKSAILAIFQKRLGWPCLVNVAIKNPSQELKNSICFRCQFSKAELKRACFSNVQSGKITMCSMLNVLHTYVASNKFCDCSIHSCPILSHKEKRQQGKSATFLTQILIGIFEEFRSHLIFEGTRKDDFCEQQKGHRNSSRISVKKSR